MKGEDMNRNTTKISGAFTLIELLVVIAIIALLLAILMPSLQKAKDQVKEVVCRSSMKQWALVYHLYANDNEDSFPQSIAWGDVNAEDAWMLGALLPYYEDLDLRDCPSTKSLKREPANANTYQNMGGTFHQWGPFLPTVGGNRWWDSYAEGSYGFNNWCANPPETSSGLFWGVLECAFAIRTVYEEGAHMTPMVYDSVWLDTAPRETDYAPSDEEHELDSYNASWANNAMKYICIDRHGGGVNAVFVDMDVRHVGVKELWLLNWYKDWVKCEPDNAWPRWTDRYKDYD